MRLVRFTTDSSQPSLGLERDGQIFDLSGADTSLPTDCGELLAVDDWRRKCEEAAATATAYPLTAVALQAPLTRPGKIVCLGLNYQSHLDETGLEKPSDPTVFAKYASSITGPNDPIVLPAAAPKRVDYEAELAFVIGRRGRDVEAAQAMDMIAGYTVANDVSARDWQLRRSGGQWLLGKTFDTFLPIGPALVTADEVTAPEDLRVTCTVSGDLLQDGNTGELLFGIAEIVSYLSTVFVLEPGDLILTGTPGGVGMSRDPRRFLQAGDTVEVAVEGIGTIRNPVAEAV